MQHKETKPIGQRRRTRVHRRAIALLILMGGIFAGLYCLTVLTAKEGSSARGATDGNSKQATAPEGDGLDSEW